MCRPEYRSYFKERKELAAEFALPADKSWGLYISSFSFATLRPEQLEEIEKISGNYKDFVELSIRSRNKTLDWIKNFMQENPEKVFIYRPHPAEHSDQRISEMEKRYPNFHVISKYSVKQWILACEYIGVWISTSCSEVYALGKIVKYSALKNCLITMTWNILSMPRHTNQKRSFRITLQGKTLIAIFLSVELC